LSVAYKWGNQYTKIIFEETITEEEIDEYMALYYRDLYQLACIGEFDILAHLTCPQRYGNSRYQRGSIPCFTGMRLQIY